MTIARSPAAPSTTRSVEPGGTLTSKARRSGRTVQASGPLSSVPTRSGGAPMTSDRFTVTVERRTLPPDDTIHDALRQVHLDVTDVTAAGKRRVRVIGCTWLSAGHRGNGVRCRP